MTELIARATPPTESVRARFPRLLAGALTAGAALVVVCDLLTPHTDTDARSLVAAVSADPDRWMLGYSLQMVAGVLLAAGVLGFAWIPPGRGAHLVRTGVGVFGVGLVGLACEAVAELMLVPVVAGGATPAVLDTVHRMDQSAALVVVFLLYLPGILLGPIILAAGLARTGRTTWWVAGALVLVTIAGFPLSGTLAGTLAVTLQTGLLAVLAWGVQARRT